MRLRSAAARIPLLWLLVPFALGLFVQSKVDLLPVWAMIATAAVVVAASLRFARTESIAWPILIALGGFASGLAYFELRREPDNPRPNFPPREANLEIEIEHLFFQRDSSVSGIARIVQTETHLSDLAGLKIHFTLDTEGMHVTSDEVFDGRDASPRRPQGTRTARRAIPTSIILPGATYRASGLLEPIEPEPSGVGFQSYLENIGASLSLKRGYLIERTKPPGPIAVLLARCMDFLQTRLTHGLDPEANYTRSYSAMLLGLKSELTAEQKDLFLKNGAMHLFAISGLHIGVIAGCIHALLLLLRIPRQWIPVPNLALIAIFALATGGAASTWRALIMIACLYLCHATRRQPSPLNALVLAAFITLAIEPSQLFSAGFQMSYCAVAAILLYGLPLAERLHNRFKPFELIPRVHWNFAHKGFAKAGRFSIDLFALSLAAFLPSAALGMIYFQVLPTYGIVSNMLILPLASLALAAGFCSIVTAATTIDWFASLFNHAAAILLIAIERILGIAAGISGSHLESSPAQNAAIAALLAATMAGLVAGYWQGWNFRVRYMLAIPPAVAAASVAIAAIG